MKAQLVSRRVWHALDFCKCVVLSVALVWGGVALAGEIHDAARKGDLAKVKELVKAHPSLVFSKDGDGNTPLIVAAKFRQTDVAVFLLANKADVNARGKHRVFRGEGMTATDPGYAALQWALMRRDRDMVLLLLSNKANINIRDGEGETPLHNAVEMGHKDLVELLLARKADVRAADNDGMTPLHTAAQYGRRDIAEVLLANRADVNARDSEGVTPLGWVVERDWRNGTVELLLGAGADINARDNDGDTPLHLAAKYCNGDATMAALLVAEGADVNAKDGKGYTPLSIPKYYACPRLTELLRQHGGTNGGE